MHRSKIEWVLNPDNKTLGWVWNPITGCLNHTNGLCNGGGFPCYAYRLANGRLKHLYLANTNLASAKLERILSGEVEFTDIHKAIRDPFYPRFWEEKIQTMVRFNSNRRKPRGIFVCDMSDLFGIGVPEEWTARVLDVCKGNWRDRFYLLTKQPQNLIKFSPFPDNCWVGVTATNPYYWNLATYHLMRTEAKVKFISAEPLLEWDMAECEGALEGVLREASIDWVIIGAQSKPTVYPKIEWVREIEAAARKAGVAIFEKDNLKALLNRELIQEMPNA